MYAQLFNSDSLFAIFPFISLFVFLAIFTTVLVWVARMKKPYLEKMSHLPLEKEQISIEETNRG